MGGLRKELPITYWTFLIGTLAIAGVPLLSGFFSKDEILWQTFATRPHVLWALAVVTAFLTATYMFRLLYLAFFGERRSGAGACRHHARMATTRTAHAHGARRRICTTRRRRWRLRWSCSRSARCVAGYVGVPNVARVAAAIGSRRSSSRASRRQAARPRRVDAAAEHPPEEHNAGTEMTPDGRLDARRVRRHRRRDVLLPQQAAGGRRDGRAVRRRAPAAARQVLRRRAVRRDDRPADQADLDGRAVARRGCRPDRRHGQRRRPGRPRLERGAAPAADRIGARLRDVASSSASWSSWATTCGDDVPAAEFPRRAAACRRPAAVRGGEGAGQARRASSRSACRS